MTLTQQTLDLILSQIAHFDTTLADVVITAMNNPDTRDSPSGVMGNISLHIEDLLEALHGHNLTCQKVSAWAHATMKTAYTSEILSLTRPDSGFHYIAKGITEDKLHEFDIDDITEQMSVDAPLVWELLDELLSADPHLRYKRVWARKRAQEVKQQRQQGDSRSRNNDVDMHDDQLNIASNNDEKYWEFFDESVQIVEENEDDPEDILDQVEQRHSSLIAIVSGSSCLSTDYSPLRPEKSGLCEHYDAELEPTMQCPTKCHRGLPSVMQHSRDGA
jgi:hypothetical protein